MPFIITVCQLKPIIIKRSYVPVEGGDVLVTGDLGAALLDTVSQHQLVGAVTVVVHVPDTRCRVTRPVRRCGNEN